MFLVSISIKLNKRSGREKAHRRSPRHNVEELWATNERIEKRHRIELNWKQEKTEKKIIIMNSRKLRCGCSKYSSHYNLYSLNILLIWFEFFFTFFHFHMLYIILFFDDEDVVGIDGDRARMISDIRIYLDIRWRLWAIGGFCGCACILNFIAIECDLKRRMNTTCCSWWMQKGHTDGHELRRAIENLSINYRP